VASRSARRRRTNPTPEGEHDAILAVLNDFLESVSHERLLERLRGATQLLQGQHLSPRLRTRLTAALKIALLLRLTLLLLFDARSVLALRAEVRAALANHNPSYPTVAAPACLALARVNPALILVSSVAPIRCEVVADARASRLDRTPQNLLQGLKDSLAFRASNATGSARGSDPSKKERLIRIDVSHAGKHALIEQNVLDGRLPSPNQREDILASRPQGIDAEFLEPRVHLTLTNHEDLPKLTHVAKQHVRNSIGKPQAQVGVGVGPKRRLLLGCEGGTCGGREQANADGSVSEQLTGHAQMQHQARPTVQGGDQVFAVSVECHRRTP